MKAISLLAAVAIGTSAVSAQAATWRFAYASDIGTFSGKIDGTLQADGNTILISAVPDFIKLRGVPLASLPFLTTGSTLYGTDRAPSVTRDGTLLDFLACSDEFCSSEGFGFDPDTIEFTPSLITSIPVEGYEFGYREAADPAKWRISAVPEPGTWALLAIGFGIVGAAARRPARAQVAA